jgi:hypothetical protein
MQTPGHLRRLEDEDDEEEDFGRDVGSWGRFLVLLRQHLPLPAKLK